MSAFSFDDWHFSHQNCVLTSSGANSDAGLAVKVARMRSEGLFHQTQLHCFKGFRLFSTAASHM
ncbi:MAG: hypothetical protein K2W95_01350 [Candidatus Obscuribacterales bacterium]|nr:hypothetical protein [Candidatus Obscuribacterales bacterium]